MSLSNRSRQIQIETLESLVLMSASGIDLDVDLAEQPDLQSSLGETGDVFTFQESESSLVLSAEPEVFAFATSQEGASVSAASAPAAPYSQYIMLDGQDNEAVLEDNGNQEDNLVQLRSTNGTFETIVFELPTDVLVIDLGAGDDSLVVDGLELGTLSANVLINGQGGDDSVVLNSLETAGDVSIYDLQGDNSLTSRRLDIGGNLFISDGDGDQRVSIVGMVAGDVSIASTSGGSLINVGASGFESTRIDGSVTIDNMGVGVDSVRLSGRVNGDLYIDAGVGDFGFRSIFSSVGGSLFTNVDDGDSTIFLGDFSASGSSFFNSGKGDTDTFLTATFFNNGLTIQNGSGFDELQLDGTSVRSDRTEPGFLLVSNGDGGSSTTLNGAPREFGLSIGEFQLYNGVGADTIDINLRPRDTLGTFFADNGDGDTTLELTGNGTVQAVTAFSGTGTDTLIIDGVDIVNDLIISTGQGDRNEDIQNSVIGNTIINGVSDTDTTPGDDGDDNEPPVDPDQPTETTFGAGNDEIFSPLGNNIIDGGAGDDVLVVYEGVRADYAISFEADGRVIVEGPGLNGTIVRNELTNVERILFNDGEISLTDGSGNGDDGGGDDGGGNGDDGGGNDGGDPLTILGTDGGEWIAVSDRGGNVEARGGDDSIYAPVSQGVNLIDGGAGIDTLVIYEGAQADYTLRRVANSSAIEVEGPGLNGSTVINRLTDVEFILFTDARVSVADLDLAGAIL